MPITLNKIVQKQGRTISYLYFSTILIKQWNENEYTNTNNKLHANLDSRVNPIYLKGGENSMPQNVRYKIRSGGSRDLLERLSGSNSTTLKMKATHRSETLVLTSNLKLRKNPQDEE